MKKLLVFLGLPALWLMSCEPVPDALKLTDQFVVITNFESDVQYGDYLTYRMDTDTIGLVSNLLSDDTIIVGTFYARPVLNAVKDNLNTRGYVRVEEIDDPDLAVNVYVLKNLDIFQQVNYYPGYGYPGYYGYYSNYYYPSVSTYVQNRGYLVVEVLDLRDTNTQGQARVIWNTYMGDLFSSANNADLQSVNGINQAFEQSPYLASAP